MLSLLIFMRRSTRDAFDLRGRRSDDAPLLSVRDLSVQFTQGQQQILAVDRVSFDVLPGQTVAIVGESGSGKSVSALSVLKLLSVSRRQPTLRVRSCSRARICWPRMIPPCARSAQPDHHDLPGTDDLTQSAAHGRAADRRDLEDHQGMGEKKSRERNAGTAAAGRHPRCRETSRCLSAPNSPAVSASA